jgi:ZIP family zinc transporter
MNSPLLQAFAYTLVPVLAALIGGIYAAYRELSPNVRSGVQHLAAGVAFATAALEMMPDVQKGSPPTVVLGFAVGVALMLALKRLSQKLEGADPGASQWPPGLLAAVGVDRVIDGLVVGIGLAAGPKLGLILTLAVTLDVLFVSVAVAATLRRNGISPGLVIATPVGLALLTLVAALVGTTLFAGLSEESLAPLLAFGAATLLYLVTEELLSEAHQVVDAVYSTALFFVGFVVFLVIDMIA